MGLGYAPIAPGTFGTVGAVLYYYLSCTFFGSSTTLILLGTAIVLFFVGMISTDALTAEWGEDPSRVVIDEFIGYMITMLLIPFSYKMMVAGFILFRFFDILKPFGIRYLDQNIKGGLGVMLDDVVAGIYACASLHLIVYLQTNFFG